jgi:hypothetical protein
MWTASGGQQPFSTSMVNFMAMTPFIGRKSHDGHSAKCLGRYDGRYDGSPGQSRPYVRPVLRRSPLTIMGVRLRVRRLSGSRARGTSPLTALPELHF